MKLHLRHTSGKYRHLCGLRRPDGERYMEWWVLEETVDPANVAVQSNGYVLCLECGALVPPSEEIKA